MSRRTIACELPPGGGSLRLLAVPRCRPLRLRHACRRACASAARAHVPGELIVKYRVRAPRAHERERIRAGRRRAFRRHGRATAASASGCQPARTRWPRPRRWRSDPRVRHALPNYVATATAFMPNDPGRGGAGRVGRRCSGTSSDPFGVRIPGAWQNAIDAGTPGGAGSRGGGARHRRRLPHSPDGRYLKAPDLDRKRFVRGHDFVRGNTLPYDRNGHGTFVAGTIAQATNNGIGVTGVAYTARIMPVRVLDYEGKGDVATIARGIRYAARRGAKVINMSFEFDIGLTASQIPDVISAMRYAHRKGVAARRGRGQHRGHARRLPGARAQRDRGRRDDRARLPGRLLEHRLGARPGGARAEGPTRRSTGEPTASRSRSPAATSTSTRSRGIELRAGSGCRPATREPRWRFPTCRAPRR